MTPPLPLDVLACPSCRGALAEEGGGLRCGGCGVSYPVDDGVPDLVPAWLRARMADGADPGWSRWNEAIRGLEAWRARRRSRARDGVLPPDGTREQTTREMFSRAGATGVVVDVGAKDGSKSLLLPAGTRYVGVDPFAVRVAGRPAGATLVRGMAEALPVADGSADAVISLAAFDFYVDGAAAVAEWDRVLRPGGGVGVLISVVPPAVARARNADSRLARAVLSFGALGDVGPSGVGELLFWSLVYRERVHTHYYTRARFLELLGERFEVVWERSEEQLTSAILYVAARKRAQASS